jgi:hypothetical protein
MPYNIYVTNNINYTRYAKKCRFAHGQEELRCVQRHARYKTEICRTFHLTGTCLYGVRCTFIHDEQVASSPSSTVSSSPLFSTMVHRPTPYILPQPQEMNNTWMFDNSNKMDIWASLFDRRYSSSSSSSSCNSSICSSSSLSIPFI